MRSIRPMIYSLLLIFTSISSAFAASLQLNYFRLDHDYNGWGLHLFGNALNLTDQTTWLSPHAFDGISNGWAQANLTINLNQFFGVIVHRGDIKSPDADLSFTTQSGINQIWIVQDVPQIFFSQAQANQAMSLIGNNSTQLDLSTQTAQATQSALAKNWSAQANVMQIYVRAYQDSDGDGQGDLQGLIQRLDYLQQLGVTALYLMPIFANTGGAGYAVEDYRAIDADYGTMQDFEDLLKQAHQRGIGIILDYVINHSSITNPLFLDASAAKTNPKRDWFIWSDTNPNWQAFDTPAWHPFSNGYYYNAFSEGLADFNFNKAEVIDFHRNNLMFWLNKGVDGFRLDAAALLVENGKDAWEDQSQTHQILQNLRDLVQQYDNRLLICEAPVDPNHFAQSCGHAFAFATQHELISSAQQGFISADLNWRLSDANLDSMPLFLSNHDAFAGARLADQVSTDSPVYRLAAASYLLNAAISFTYYGEEIGMKANGQTGEEALRGPMSWGSADPFSRSTPFAPYALNSASQHVSMERTRRDSLYQFYHDLLNLRRQYPVIGMGTRQWQSQAGDAVLKFTRQLGTQQVAVAINLSTQPQAVSLNTTGLSQTYQSIYPTSLEPLSSNSQGQLNWTMPAQSIRVWYLGPTRAAVTHDVDGDGYSDLFWRHQSNGQTYGFTLQGPHITQTSLLSTLSPQEWSIATIGDFNGDKRSDILWRHRSSGANYLHFLQGLSKPTLGYINTVPNPWRIIGSGDFNGDHTTDLLWQNPNSGEVWVYLMRSEKIQSAFKLSRITDSQWQLGAVGDFDHDGDDDLLWRHASTGQNYLYQLQAGHLAAGKLLNTIAPIWRLAPAGDFNGDGYADLVWRHQGNGAIWLHLLKADLKVQQTYLSTVSNLNWQIAQVGDYNADGHSDLFWREQNTGEHYLYFIYNGQIIQRDATDALKDLNWQLVP